MTKGQSRDSYKDAGAAARAAIIRTLELNPRKSTLAVLLALVAEVPTWSRLGDTIGRGRIVSLTGLSPREVTRAVNWLRDHDVILWFPGGAPAGGHRTLSRVVFPRSTGDLSDHRSGETPVTPQTPTGDLSDTDQGPGGHRLETSRGPTTEKSEGLPRSGASLAVGAGAPHGEARLRKQLQSVLVRCAVHAGATVPMPAIEAVVDYIAQTIPWALDDLALFADGEYDFIGDKPARILRLLLDIEESDDGYSGDYFQRLDKAASAIESDPRLGELLTTWEVG